MDFKERLQNDFGRADRPEPRQCRGCGAEAEPTELPNGRWIPASYCRDCMENETDTSEDRFWSKFERAVDSKRHREAVEDLELELVGPLARLVGSAPASTGSVYLHGEVGTGKTTQAVYAVACYLWRGVVDREDWTTTARMVEEPELFAQLRDAMDDAGDPVGAVLGEYKSADLLVLDDVGRANPTPWVAEQFYLLLNDRYKQQLPVIFTSNYSLTELDQLEADKADRDPYDDRIVSRIAEMVGGVGSDRITELTTNYRR